MRFPSFRAFRKIDSEPVDGGNGPEKTPEESLRKAYQTLRRTLESDLLERVRGCSPKFFENLVLDVLFAMGYGGSRRDALRAVGRSGDEGIDGVIDQDRLGLEKIYVQAKRWTGTVGRPVVQAFAGSLEGAKARKGVLISTSEFSQDAEKYAQGIEKRIILVNGSKLAGLMIDYGVGVTGGEILSLKKIDMEYFSEQA
jgi:restriction system protein